MTASWRGWLPGPGFPLRFRCRHSLLGHPIPARELSSPCGRLTGQDHPPGPRRGYHVPHARAATGVGAPYNPRTVVLARPGRLPDRHPPLPSGQSLNPATTSHHARLSFTGHQQGFTHVHPSGLPLARAPGVEPATLRLPPELRAPPSPATHVRGGDRPSSTDLELPLNSHPSISNPVVHSMRATSRRTATRREAGDLRVFPPVSARHGSLPRAERGAHVRKEGSGVVGRRLLLFERQRSGRANFRFAGAGSPIATWHCRALVARGDRHTRSRKHVPPRMRAAGLWTTPRDVARSRGRVVVCCSSVAGL